jgi:LuxR family maltose regulon positive regulatory protein
MPKGPPSPKQERSDGPLAPIVTTKLVPPRAAGRIIGRDRLIKQLLDARRMRCIVLQGPAGCGKTTAMVAWRQALLPLHFDVGWLTLTSDDNELTRWLDYLLASLAKIDPELTRDAAQLAGRGIDSEAVERTIIALVRAIAVHPRELVLILDDLHAVTDRGILEALQLLLDYAPDNLHLACVSRSGMPVSLARLRNQGLVLELDLRDLRFLPAESEEFLRAQVGSIERREAQLLHELTDGWVAGLQLLCIDRKKRVGADAVDKAPRHVHLQDARAFADYFEREVLSRLPADEIALLERAAACNRFSASLCAALLGRSEALPQTAALLARLERDNVFILPVEGADRELWYRLHPLLSETLRERLNRRGAAECQDVHRAAWRWFRDRGLLDEAVRHAVLAGEESAAADLLEQCARDLVIRGDLRKLISLVRALPLEQVQRRIELRLWMARSQLYARELDVCATNLERLKVDVPEGDAGNRFALVLMQAMLAVQRDDTDEAMAILPELLQPPASVDAFAIGGRNNILSWLYMHRGEFERAREFQADTSRLLPGGAPLMGTASGILQGRCLVGLSHALEGHMTLAERVYRDVLHQAEQGGSAWIDPAYLAAALLGEVLYEANEIQGALRLLEDRVDVLERVSIPDSVLRVLIVLSRSHRLAGRHLEAFAYLERLQDYATNLRLDRLLAYSLDEQLHHHLQRNEFEEARRLIDAIMNIDTRHPEADNSTLGEIAIIRRRAEIRWHLAMGDFENAAAQLGPLLSICEARGRRQLVAQFKLQSALINRRLGQLAPMRSDVSDALRLGQRLGLVRSLLDVDAAAIGLINDFVRENEPDPLLTFYIERLEAAAKAGIAVSTGRATPSPDNREILSDRESEVMRLLGEAMPNKKIARTLGLSPETVKWHLKNIYGKLSVSSRDEAVARMRDLTRQSLQV